MSKNSEIIEDFKKSLSATIKSIGKKEDIEINFVKENPSIIGNTINLTEPKIENFKNNLEYLRAEADSFALEFRLHSKDIHQNFLNQDELSNQIINVLEQARVEAIGSNEFKGIQKNLKNKYIRDLKIGNTKKDQNLLIKAFKNVAFEEIVGVDLGENNSSFKNIVKEKLKKDYSKFIFGEDNDTLSSVLIKELTKRNETIVFAESCTGGLLSSSLTSISGSSQVFKGSIVSYSNELKNSLLNISEEKLTKYGAVSEEVCEAMAVNVKEKLGADWAIAISGIAGPNGGSTEKPVGLVYISISGPNNHLTNIKKIFKNI